MQPIFLNANLPVSNWPSLAWRGLASVGFGVLAFAWPRATLAALTILYGAYALADGVLAVIVALRREHRRYRSLLVLDGVLGIATGVITFFWPRITLLVLVYIVGLRALFMGALEIGAAVRFHGPRAPRVLYGLGGGTSVVFGILTFFAPGVSALVLVLLLGSYALVFGVALLALALRVRQLTHHRPAGVAQPA
ncbi:MAG: HdeD family acid-resistance protein [Myxococcales bacterium]|nr:HdeD family acid-resistance protein [Myxococcales bacterium]